jgi:formylmethanofuran dehydrogenase subunit D
MAVSTLTLITGRTTKQGVGISMGKEMADYQEATTVVELSQADMARLGLHDGDIVQIKSQHGAATVKCRPANLPEGLAFMAFGPATGHLIGGETQMSGMPDAKGFEIELTSPANDVWGS